MSHTANAPTQTQPCFPILLTRLIVVLTQATQHAPTDQGIPDAARPALIALHVIYPHILLDAFDLLDRGCVIKLTVSPHAKLHGNNDGRFEQHRAPIEGVQQDAGPSTQLRHEIVAEMTEADAADPTSQSAHRPNASAPSEPENHKQAYTAYHVRSARPPPSRFAHSDSPYAASKGYTIHLAAWNCSCPAFAYAAFGDAGNMTEQARLRLQSVLQRDGESDAAVRSAVVGDEGSVLDEETRRALPNALRYGFGGLDYFEAHGEEGKETLRVKRGREALPACCKHLLACVLAEAMPGVFVVEGGGEQSDSAAAAKGVVQGWIDLEEAAGWAAGAGFGL